MSFAKDGLSDPGANILGHGVGHREIAGLQRRPLHRLPLLALLPAGGSPAGRPHALLLLRQVRAEVRGLGDRLDTGRISARAGASRRLGLIEGSVLDLAAQPHPERFVPCGSRKVAVVAVQSRDCKTDCRPNAERL